MNAVIEMKPSGALASTQNSGRMAVADLIQHVAVVQEVMRAVMKKDVHFGIIPGTDKPTLYKAGAEVLCMVFRIASSYEVEDLSTADVTRYRVTCTGTHQTTGVVLGAGMGEASSGEEKYKWRKAYEPEFNETPANLRRTKMGYNKQKKENYTVFQVRTEQADLANTVLKMANKRAHMAMVLSVTAASDCFAQDLEDMDEALRDHLTRHEVDAPDKPEQPTEPAFYPQADFDANLSIWKKAIAKGTKPNDAIAKVNAANPKTPLSEVQKEMIRALEVKPIDTKAEAPTMTFAKVAEMISKAETMDALNDAATVIDAVPDAVHRAELIDKFDARRAELA